MNKEQQENINSELVQEQQENTNSELVQELQETNQIKEQLDEQSKSQVEDQTEDQVSIKESLIRENLIKDSSNDFAYAHSQEAEDFKAKCNELILGKKNVSDLLEEDYNSDKFTTLDEIDTDDILKPDDIQHETIQEKNDNNNYENKKYEVKSKDIVSEEQKLQSRLNRIRVIKKMMLIIPWILILITLLLSIFGLIKIHNLSNDVENLQDQITTLLLSKADGQDNMLDDISSGSEVAELEDNMSLLDDFSDETEMNIIDPYEGYRKVYLTFDDGPSKNTDEILNILEDYDVKATFFVVGKGGFDDQYRRIVEDGHTIGMHSYCHSYNQIYQDMESFENDFFEIQSYIKDITGVTCKYYRFPGGSSNTVSNTDMKYFISFLVDNNIDYVDWNVSSEDAAGAKTATEIVNNVIGQIEQSKAETLIVLMHDSADKTATVEALPIIIEKIQDMDNVVILPIDNSTNIIQHVNLDALLEQESVSENELF